NFYAAQAELESAESDSADLGAAHDAEQVSADSLAGAGNDPLAEADIYIAYGRFNQAAELLQNALNDEPQRSDLRLKLMEVYAELGDRDGFARQEAELREIGGSFAEIEQTKARYPAMAAAGFGAAAASTSDDFDTFSLDDLELEEPAPVTEQKADDDFDLSLDDLELDDDLAVAPVAPASEATPELDDVNFDEISLEVAAQEQSADDFSFDLDEPAATENVSLDDELAGFSLDLDEQPSSSTRDEDLMLGLGDEAKPASTESVDEFDFELTDAAQPADMPDEFDLSLDDEPVAPAAPETLSSELEVVEAELEDLSRDFNEPVDPSPEVAAAAAEPAASAPEALDDDFDFFADTDETTTKLDLARAYIDMGDAEGARDILDEVMSEGSDTQQQEAREMLAKLA
ncbi:MAG TPA: peptigoglycan-binding protein LysM, partial [Pseudomonas sp.]|nr:peptigoglycan-binding protein LysM [Pseudomonas sp.]